MILEDKIMNKILIIFCISISFKIHSVLAIQELDRIIAIVNKEPITFLELEQEKEKAFLFFKQNNIEVPDETIITKKVLDEIIEKKIILTYAGDWNIEVSQEEIDQLVSNITDSNNITIDEFKENLLSQNTSYASFVDSMRYEILLKKVKNKEISSKLNISEFEVEKHKKKLSKITPDLYEISHILLKFSTDPSPEEKNQKRVLANEIIQKITDNEDFKKIAYEFSDAPDANEGGYLGELSKNELPEIFVDNITGLKSGDISEPFESNNGIHIVKINNIESLKEGFNSNQFVNKYFLKQIVMRTNEIHSETDVIDKLKKYKQEIENGGDFENYAKKYSEDYSSTSGGEIGWITEGFDPSLDAQLLNINQNEISEPFKTSLGWHIILYTDKKSEDVGKENIDNQIKMDLIKERTEILYQDWFSALKNEAFIEYRNE